VLKAFYYKQGELKLYAEENITIHEEGDYILDIILFPPLTEISKVEKMEDIEFPTFEEQKENGFPIQIMAVLVVVGIIVAGLFIIRRRSVRIAEPQRVVEQQKIAEQPEKEETHIDEAQAEIPDDLKEVLEILKKEGGRITQKELRRRLGYSEAKMSLIIADLERRGFVEKVKKGRGNTIFLKEY
jgi:uncharacterized membrane protein